MSATIASEDSFIDLLKYRLEHIDPVQRIGYVKEIVVTTLKASLPDVMQGELCEIEVEQGRRVLAEVVAFDQHEATLSCLESVMGIALGARVTPLGRPHCVKVSSQPGVILDGMGRSMNAPQDRRQGVLSTEDGALPVMTEAPPASQRPPIAQAFPTGVRVIDGLLTLGAGQRVGIFAPPGCGKSTLMAQIVRGAQVDAVVFGLVGERGRELREFMEREITSDIRARSYFVCSTSDKSPLERVRSAFTATSIAEYLRDQGKSVLLLIDSLTRLARAQREIGLMAGEPTTQSGFTPSVYALMPELIERAGRTPKGDITAIYTVLMESERIEDDPIASEAKSLLDGHIVLTGKLVERAQFPAVDCLKSLSRVMNHVTTPRGMELGSMVRRAYSLYQEVELLIRLNEYQAGTDTLIDEAVKLKPQLDQWCRQDRFAVDSQAKTQQALERILQSFENVLKALT